MNGEHQEPPVARRVGHIGRGQGRAGHVMGGERFGDDGTERLVLLGRVRVGCDRSPGEIGVVDGLTDVLLPYSAAVDDPHPQRVVMVGHRRQNGLGDLVCHAGVDAQHQRRAPTARLGQASVEESQNVRRHSRVEVTGVLAGQPAGCMTGDDGIGQRGQRGIVVKVLRGEFDAFVGGGHRHPDRHQRVAADVEEVVSRGNRLHAEALRPDPVQRGVHLGAGVHAAAGLAGGRPGGLGRRRCRARGLPYAAGGGIDPIALAGKGVTGQSDPLWMLAVKPSPVDIDAGRPQLAQCEQEGVPVVARLHRVTHQSNRTVGLRPPGHAHGRSGQAAARTDFDQHSPWVFEQGLEFIGEPHGGPDVPGPPTRICSFLVGHPGPGQIRQHRDLRGVQSQRREELGERREHRVHGLRVKAVRGADTARDDPGGGKPIGDITDGLLRAGEYTTAELVDRRQVHPVGHVDGDVVVSGRDRDHCTGRCGVHQSGAHRDDLDRGVEVENSGHRGGHQFADAVPYQRGGLYSVRHGQSGECVLHGEQRGLGEIRGLQ